MIDINKLDRNNTRPELSDMNQGMGHYIIVGVSHSAKRFPRVLASRLPGSNKVLSNPKKSSTWTKKVIANYLRKNGKPSIFGMLPLGEPFDMARHSCTVSVVLLRNILPRYLRDI